MGACVASPSLAVVVVTGTVYCLCFDENAKN